MKVKTSNFGEIELNEDTFITFPTGILGFPNYKKYAIIDVDENSPLKWLQSVEEPAISFVITDPSLFYPGYSVDAWKNDLADIEIDEATDAIVLIIVTVPTEPALMTGNLKGPILINAKTRLAKQLIIDNPDYDIKFRLLPDDLLKQAI
ncbi:MAG: flagellar assembly protein FliW [Candidatus Cloacimonetes bacterium]|nr:flagellar assembly protein FliW [Candidatus Cloacimonadota bacterium]